MADPRSWTVASRGLNLRVWELGRDGVGGPDVPVICLHGWLDQGLAWAAALDGRPGRWMALDQRGFGCSDHLGAGGYYHFMDLVADLDALVEALGGVVDLVGHSMGGTVACCYAGARPDRVRRLVAVEGLGALASAEDSQLQRLRRHLAGLRAPPGAPRDLGTLEQAAQQLAERHPGIGAAHALLLAQHGTTIDGRGARVWSADPLHRVPGSYPFREAWFAEFLGAIRAPTLLVWATRSWYDAAQRAQRAAAIGAPWSEAVLEGGHMLPYDQPAALGDLIAVHLGHNGAREAL